MTTIIHQTKSSTNLWRVDVEIPTSGIQRPNKECLGHYESEAAANQAIKLFKKKISETYSTTTTSRQNADAATIIALRMHLKAEQYLRQKQNQSTQVKHGATPPADLATWDTIKNIPHC